MSRTRDRRQSEKARRVAQKERDREFRPARRQDAAIRRQRANPLVTRTGMPPWLWTHERCWPVCESCEEMVVQVDREGTCQRCNGGQP